MNKINVFWIEDNPIQDNVDADNLPILPYPNFFSIKLFQHPKEIMEYLTMVHELGENGINNLADVCPWALPDIVVFDYKLSDNFNTSNKFALQYGSEYHRTFLKDNSASAKMKETFALFNDKILFLERTDVRSGNYSSDEFKNELFADSIHNVDDEFGLFSGITIIREFREYITLGVPSTVNKEDKNAMTLNSLFYEWINSYDIKDAIERPQRGNKNWNSILEFCIPLLRTRIVNQIRNSRIVPDLDQIVDMFESEDYMGEFRFHSFYGERQLSIEALFVTTAQNDKSTAVRGWASDILETLPMGYSKIKKAVAFSKDLWGFYLKCFEDRMIMSDYTLRKKELNDKERDYLKTIKKRLNVDPKTGLIAEDKQYSIKTLLDQEKDKEIKRITVLITVVRATIKMQRHIANSDEKERCSPLSFWDYFNILFPKVNFGGKILLPMHYNSDTEKGKLVDKDKKWLARNLSGPHNEITETNIFQFADWVSKGEKLILKSIFYNDMAYFPDWLIN